MKRIHLIELEAAKSSNCCVVGQCHIPHARAVPAAIDVLLWQAVLPVRRIQSAFCCELSPLTRSEKLSARAPIVLHVVMYSYCVTQETLTIRTNGLCELPTLSVQMRWALQLCHMALHFALFGCTSHIRIFCLFKRRSRSLVE